MPESSAEQSKVAGDNVAPLPVPADAGAAEEDSLTRIRDILFGAEMRAQKRRLSRSEERSQLEVSQVRTDIDRRVEDLQRWVETEVRALSDRITAEQAARQALAGELRARQAELAQLLEQRVSDLDRRASDDRVALRRQMREQGGEIRQELREKLEQLAAAVSAEVEDLQRNKTDRAALAGFLQEIALRIQNDLELGD